MTDRKAWTSTPRSAAVANPLAPTSRGHAGSSSLAANDLEHVLTKVISDIERLESMVALQRGMMGQRSALDAGRLKRQTERFAEGIEATTASLRQARAELKRIEQEMRAERTTTAATRKGY